MQNNSKNTVPAPIGPYSVQKRQRPIEEGAYAYHEIYAKNGCPLAQVFGHGEQEQTAALMATSYELLLVCKLARNDLKSWMKAHGEDVNTRAVISAINSAIAKAEPRS